MKINNNVSFTGFTDVTVGNVPLPNSKSGAFVVSTKLNNEGANDLDRFQKLLTATNRKNNILTIYNESIPAGLNPFHPIGASNVNGFPLLDDIVDIKKFPLEAVKESEKVTMPLVQDTIDLLKRIAANQNAPKTEAFNASFDTTAKAMCGPFLEFPGALDAVSQRLKGDYYAKGSDLIKETSEIILKSFTELLIKYFK